MKKVQLTEEEILMLLDAIHEWKSGNFNEDSGFTKKKLRSMDSAERVLLGILNT